MKNIFKKNIKYAVADSIKSTCGIIAIISIIIFFAFFILNDTFGLVIYLFGKKTTTPSSKAIKNKQIQNRKLKPIYLANGEESYQ